MELIAKQTIEKIPESCLPELKRFESLFTERTPYANGWSSLNLVTHNEGTKILNLCETTKNWLSTMFPKVSECYVARLKTGGSINFHTDYKREQLSRGLITCLNNPEHVYLLFNVNGNIIKASYPEERATYRCRFDIPHAVVNLSKEDRYTLCIIEDRI